MEIIISEKIEMIKQLLDSYKFYSEHGTRDNSVKQFALAFVEIFPTESISFGVSNCFFQYERVATTNCKFGTPIFNRPQLYNYCLKQILSELSKEEKHIVEAKLRNNESYNIILDSLFQESQNSLSKIAKKIKSLIR